MSGKILDIIGEHPVHDSIVRVLDSCAKRFGWEYIRTYAAPGKMKRLLRTKTKVLSYSSFKPEKGSIFLLNSPLLFLEGWEFLLKGFPHIIREESYSKGAAKDAFSCALLGPFRDSPFIAQTKRTEAFLKRCGIREVFLIPPAEKKKNGAKIRKHILWVGRLTESKNPFLFVKLAEHFGAEQFVMIGGGELAGAIREKAKTIPNLTIIERVEKKEDLEKYYAEAKLLVHPPFKDPIGHVVVEALSVQTPALVSSGAGVSDFLPREWVASPDNFQEWVGKISAITSGQAASLKAAEKIFESEHLDLDSPYLEEAAEGLSKSIRRRWACLFPPAPK